MYKIKGWLPSDSEYSKYAFSIILTNEYKKLVEKSGLKQSDIDKIINRIKEHYLTAYGFYEKSNIIIDWGAYGIEHITIPGNACGLDIAENGCFYLKENEAILLPHNIDSINQSNLILAIFLHITDILETYDE